MFTFVFSLPVSRLLDVQIDKATKKLVAFLGNHKSLRDFVLKISCSLINGSNDAKKPRYNYRKPLEQKILAFFRHFGTI
jgi:hypothetical protein